MYIRPTMAERSLGRVLWRWRDNTGMSLTEACEKAGFSIALLSMAENALRPFDPLNTMILGRVYGIPNEVWKREVRRAEFAAEARTQARAKKSPLDLNATRDMDEAALDATAVCAFGADTIPRLFQTPEYRKAAGPAFPALEDDDPILLAELHSTWIKNFSTDASSSPTVSIVLTRRALHRVVANEAVTSAALVQLVHLSELEDFTVQVLDDEACLGARAESSYCHLTFPHTQHDDVVYLESAEHGQYIEDPATCQLIHCGFKALQQCALSPAQSVQEIAEAASTLQSRTPRRSPSRKPRPKTPRSTTRTEK
ncbi:Scr1 family TA system antitoxin-like transcriptional regulator [Lentzea rhizosphaerae]|uniref:Scr1 family TA system antitoxin-like transcriptional regulator n=1 Tax=Lentzea rhizosphaerae TaxID=2041025 RepID=A0ABV8BMS8_9PSEU